MGWDRGWEVEVPARTLSSILDEVAAPDVDLLSLDVEGFEAEVVKGLDLERHRPRYLLVEVLEGAASRERLEEVLGDRYTAVEAALSRSTCSTRAVSRPSGERSVPHRHQRRFRGPRWRASRPTCGRIMPELVTARPKTRFSVFLGEAGRQALEGEPWAHDVDLVTHPCSGCAT